MEISVACCGRPCDSRIKGQMGERCSYFALSAKSRVVNGSAHCHSYKGREEPDISLDGREKGGIGLAKAVAL